MNKEKIASELFIVGMILFNVSFVYLVVTKLMERTAHEAVMVIGIAGLIMCVVAFLMDPKGLK